MNSLPSLSRSISPPQSSKATRARKLNDEDGLAKDVNYEGGQPNLAAIEAGEVHISDHLSYFAERLEKMRRPVTHDTPQLSVKDFVALYRANQHQNGRHFVVHQHNHPIAGLHYDLRLQFSETSSMSFAIPYGLPGKPNSRRQGRMAIETRVHNLWNNLIESASHATGSLLIWDIGEYRVLPRNNVAMETDDELSEVSANEKYPRPAAHENEKLIQAFQSHYIRLRLQGTRLPKNYTITLRLPSENNRVNQTPKPAFSKRKTSTWTPKQVLNPGSSTSEDDGQSYDGGDDAAAYASDQHEDEQTSIQANNAYPGATNNIGSIHQRHWFLMLDKQNSGFVKAHKGLQKGQWVRSGSGGFDPFLVRGADFERSIITGRLSAEVMADEGVEGFTPRKRWIPVME